MLQDELNAARAELQSFQEEMESSNEELETSKEELQSFNEKLQTVNTQLEQKITELEETTNDLDNLLAGTEIATLFLDTHLAIKWFTPQTVSLFDLQSSDLGRSISHFAHKFAGERLETDAEQVLKTLASTEVEVRSTTAAGTCAVS